MTYNITPTNHNTIILEQAMRTSLSKSLHEILDCCSALVTDTDYHNLREKISLICEKNQVSPFLYGLNSQLIAAIEAESQTLAIQALELLKTHAFICKEPVLNTASQLIQGFHKEIMYNIDDTRFFDEGHFTDIEDNIISNYDRALFLLKKLLPNYYHEHLCFNKNLILFKKANKIMGSSFNLFGLSYYPHESFEISAIDILDRLCHELGHQFLYIIFSIDPIVLNEPAKMYHNPFRPDPRPMTGVYHGTVALYRIVSMLRVLHKNSDTLTMEEIMRVKELKDKYTPMLDTGISVLNQHAILTENGKTLTESICY